MICAGQSTTLTATGGPSYAWSNGPTTVTNTVTPIIATTYTVSVTVNGCTATDPVTVAVIECLDSCVCNPNAVTTLTKGGINYAIGCAHGPFTPSVGCPVGSATITSDFGCVSTSGGPCPSTSVVWELVDPAGNVSSGSMLSPLSLHFPPHMVAAPGGYTLNLSTVCPGSPDTCLCVARWVQEPCDTVCPSCPPNTVQGPELIYNGDFSKGYNAFSTDFRPKFTPGSSTAMGGFSVLNALQISLADTDWACLDHTTGSLTDKFLVCDGPAATLSGTNAWKQGVQVKPGRHYTFCVFVNNLRKIPPTPGDYTDPEVEVLINSVPVTATITVPESPDQWVLISTPWESGINTLALIEIRSVAPGSTGNDLAVDDVSFRECMTDTCYCGPFADMFVRWPQEATGSAVACGDTLAVTCEAGLNATFTGTFLCNGSACAGNPLVDWVLLDPSSNVIASGTTSAVPYFGVALPPSYFATSGVYKLQLTGHCGSEACACVIFLSVQACLDPCACDAAAVQSFQSGVNKGFANVLWNNSCKACFSPLALKDCETVEWQVNGVSVGTSVGNQPFCQIFPNAGTYTITMIATRKKSDGGVCETFSKSQKVNITCSVPDDCPSTVVPNPQFSQGGLFGGLNTGGISDGWSGPIGNPYMLTGGVEMTVDSSVMFLWGNNEGSDVLSRDTFDCWPKDTGMISLRTKVDWFLYVLLPPIESTLQPIPAEDPCPTWCFCHPCPPGIAAPFKPGESFHLRLYNGDVSNLDCDSGDCFELASFLLPEPDTLGTWFTIELPYDTRIWDPTGTGGGCTPDPFPDPDGVSVRPAIYITNWLGNNQGDSRSAMMLDGMCFKSTTVAAPVVSPTPAFRIFPNPNPGTFHIELSAPAQPGLVFRIVGLTGQRLREQRMEIGTTMQTVQASDLPAGLYFLQVVAEGRVVAVEKFVKQ